MFGYIVANASLLDDERVKRYRAYYCGLCHTLKAQNGGRCRLTLNYDMTFLVMVLTSVYASDTTEREARCAIHPLKKHKYISNEMTGYAADLNVLLSYYSQLDHWKDDRNLFAYALSAMFKKPGGHSALRHPRQTKAILDGLDALSDSEKKGELCADVPAGHFGSIMGELFAIYEDENAEKLRQFGRALGRFIYIIDACCDFEADVKRLRYNPLVSMSRSDFEPLLTMLAAECSEKLQELPLKEDRDIIENIIYSGMWTRYLAAKKNKKAGGDKEDDSGKEAEANK